MSGRTAGFDIVTAITENTINLQFDQLFRQGTIRPRLTMQLADTGITIDAALTAPTVSLLVPDTTATVLFQLRLADGTFTYYEGFGRSAVQHEIPVKNWVYGFRVNMNFRAISAAALDPATVPDAVRHTLTSFDPSLFTIRQLLLDFENADLADYDPAHTEMPLPDGRTPSPNTLAQWQTALSSYFTSLKGSSNPYILGYAVHAVTPTAQPDVPALLNPTAGTFSTFQSGARTVGEGLSTLNFLLRTGDPAQRPVPPVPPNGVFATPLVTDRAVDGAMVIAADVFRSGYLEPILVPRIGTAAGVPPLTLVAPPAGTNEWVWTSSHEDDDYDRWVDRIVVANVYQNHQTYRDCTATFGPGNQLLISGTLRETYGWYTGTAPNTARVDRGGVTVTRHWQAGMTLTAGEDGRLTWTLAHFTAGDPDVQKWESGFEQFLDMFNAGVGQAENAVADAVAATQGAIVAAVQTELTAALSGLGNRVVLPGGDAFFFADAALDTELNLVCAVEYKTARPDVPIPVPPLPIDPGTPPVAPDPGSPGTPSTPSTPPVADTVALTSSSQLMTNHEAGRALDPQHRFEVFQDAAGDPALLSIGTDGVLRLVHRDAASATGWAQRTIGDGLVPGGAPRAIAVSQQADGPVRLVLAIGTAADGADDRLFVTRPLSNDPSAADWGDLAHSWVARPSDVPVGQVTRILTGTADDGAGAPLTVVATELNGQAQHWLVAADPDTTAGVWQRYLLPENAVSLTDLAIGTMFGQRGVYSLYDLAGGAHRLEFATLPDPATGKTAHYAFDLPVSVARIAALPTTGASSDLYAAGDGVLVYPGGRSTPVTVAAGTALTGVSDLLVRSDGASVSLFAVAGDDVLWHVSGDAAHPEGPWSPPLVLARSGARLAALRSRVWLNNHVVYGGADGLPGYLWQDPRSGLWSQTEIPLPDTGTVVSYPSYTTEVRLTTIADGLPATGLVATLTSSTLGEVLVNGRHHRVGPGAVARVPADALGRLTVVGRTGSLAAVRLTVSAEGLAPVTVNPAEKVLAALQAVTGPDDLAAARYQHGPRAGQPVLASPPDRATLTRAATAINRLATLPAATSGSTTPPGATSPSVPASFAALAAPATQGVVRTGLGDAITAAAGDVLQFLRQTADEIADLEVQVSGEIATFFVTVGQTLYTFTISTLEHVLDGINWVLEKVLGISLQDLIDWIGFAFDWDDIVATHTALRQLVDYTLQYATHELDAAADELEASVDGIAERLQTTLEQLAGLPALPAAVAERRAGLATSAPGLLSALSGDPAGNWAGHHLLTGGGADQVLGSVLDHNPLIAAYDDVLVPAFASVSTALNAITDAVQRGLTGELTPAQVLEAVGIDTLVGLFDTAGRVFAGLIRLVGDFVDAVRALLDATIDIPVISAVYTSVTGADLSLLDLGCLLIAIPSTIVYRGLSRRSLSDELATLGLGVPGKTYQDVFGALGASVHPAPTPASIVSSAAVNPAAVNPAAVSPAAVSDGHDSSGNPLLTDIGEPVILYSQVGGVIGEVADWAGVGFSIYQAAKGIAETQADDGGLLQGNGTGAAAPTGRIRFQSPLDYAAFIIDIVGTAMTFPVGADPEIPVQRAAWGTHLGGELLLMGIKHVNFGAAQPGGGVSTYQKVVTGSDMTLNSVLFVLSCAIYGIETENVRSTDKVVSTKEAGDQLQNGFKWANNLLLWASKILAGAAELVDDPKIKGPLCATSAGAVFFGGAFSLTRLIEGIVAKRDIQEH
ncbi:MAG TPA: hypothetical protein VI248_00560 [Kineosporiaceae bacterium]